MAVLTIIQVDTAIVFIELNFYWIIQVDTATVFIERMFMQKDFCFN